MAVMKFILSLHVLDRPRPEVWEFEHAGDLVLFFQMAVDDAPLDDISSAPRISISNSLRAYWDLPLNNLDSCCTPSKPSAVARSPSISHYL